jgi:hypothetical protein
MSVAAQPELEPGQFYRTSDLRQWGENPARLAQRLVHEGRLRRAAHGLFYVPRVSRFGEVPASDKELMRAFLSGGPFVMTGPPYWNALGLGSTAMFAATLVYNTQRTGEFVLDGRRFLLRRVSFPEQPTPEWFIIDLLQHHDMAGVSLSELLRGLVATLRAGRWDIAKLHEMAAAFGTKATRSLVEEAIAEARTAT